jgi:GT2 family glycosyltransferase
MKLSVVVVNWNSREDLLACLDALERQTHRDLEVVVVDNASNDGSVEEVRERFPRVTLLAQRENLGFAEGCNRGIAAASAPWIALLNNDAVADARWAEELMLAAERGPEECGMLQSLMLFQSEPDKINSTGIELAKSGGGRDRHENRRRPPPGGPLEEIFCPTGGAAAYRRTMLDRLRLPTGWLDREHFCYYEDMDLGWRARLAGWRAFFVPSSWVLHRYHGSTSRRGEAWLIQITGTNRIRTLLKNASWPFLLATSHHTVFDVAQVLRHGRLPAAKKLVDAVRSGLAQRQLVDRLATQSRRSIERAWVR